MLDFSGLTSHSNHLFSRFSSTGGHMRSTYLPQPLRLDRSYLRKQLLPSRFTAFLVVLAVCGGFLACYETALKLEERRVWTTGALATDVGYEGDVRKSTKLGIPTGTTYRLNVRYSDANGVAHEGKTRFDLCLTEAPLEETPEVRFAPADPKKFAISYWRGGEHG